MTNGFYSGRRVLVTGHTGFKGSWLCRILQLQGAFVGGYSLPPPRDGPSLFQIARIAEGMSSTYGDIRDRPTLCSTILEFQPEIVIHMAAQTLVRSSYQDPVLTYETNVIGTANVLEAIRQCPAVRSAVIVTTDKVYLNREWEWAYRENDALDGYDPYSNSKSCAELVTNSFRSCFFDPKGVVAVSTARAGNVIGGGDFAKDRIVPDCVRSVLKGVPIEIRSPESVRPYQYVLEPLGAYLMIAREQHIDRSLQGAYNVGPNENDSLSTGALASLFCEAWGEGARWVVHAPAQSVHEATLLRLDSSRIRSRLGWKPQFGIREAVALTVAWTRCYSQRRNVKDAMDEQIRGYTFL